VNWRHAPPYKLSKLFTNKINHIAPLPNAFNVRNTKELIQNLKETPLLPHFTFASKEKKNLYPSIPVKETKTILDNMLTQNIVDLQIQQELLHWCDIITKQNYSTNNNEIVIQQDGLAMGAPSSDLIAEIFLRHMEHLHLAHLTHRHRIINYW
jgi:hypothetical protein